MVELLFIHGACFGAWAWDAVIPALKHPARAIDFSNGTYRTLHDQARAILDALDGPTVLVGHSAGGFAITAAAQMDPSRIAGLIYLCAYIPQPAKSVAQMRRDGPHQPLSGAMRIAADRLKYGFDPAYAAQLFFHDCPDPIGAAARLCDDWIAPVETALPNAAHTLPRGAIICTDDRTIPPEYQVKMAQGIARQTTLPSGHSPFLSMPIRLAQTLDDMAAQMIA